MAISYAFFFVLPMSSLITGESLVELFGDNICMPFFMAQTFHNIWMTVSGFGISLFRFTCMWDNLLIFEKDKLKTLMKGIFVGEIIMTLFQMFLSKYFTNPEWWADICINDLYFSANFGTYLSQKAFALDFCHGFGQEFVSILQEYNGLDIETAILGKTMMETSSMVTFIFIPATIALYGFIFWRLLKTNKINKLGNL